MSMPLDIRIVATVAHQKASSDCCGAGIDVVLGSDVPAYLCRNCKSTCGRVLGPPKTIEVTNG